MNTGKALVAIGLVQALGWGWGESQPDSTDSTLVEASSLTNYSLKLKEGFVDGAAIPSTGTDPILGHEYEVSAPAGTPEPYACKLIATEGAIITVNQGSRFKIGSFVDGSDTVQYLELLCGSLSYAYAGATNLKLGTGRKYIVRTKGRAIGALGTRYTLALNNSCSEARLNVQEGEVGIVNVKGVLNPDYANPFKKLYINGEFEFQEPTLDDIGGFGNL